MLTAIKTKGGKMDANNSFLEGLATDTKALLADSTTYAGLFVCKPANDWIREAKNRPIPRKLFSEFWHEGELCILFADTNLGKSILAVQIGESIAKGEAIRGFHLEAKKSKVIYFDFELSDKQFENRYSIEYAHHYQFDDNFIRAEIDSDGIAPSDCNFEDFLFQSIEQTITQTRAKVLIVDNLTYLKNGTETAKDALPLMKQLKELKRKHGLSILALAHTPKRDLSKPITRNDLQGSKMLINFVDSCFAIGESSTDTGIRYLKQIKQRNTEQVYDSENVINCQISKPYNFLQFEFIGFGTERQHLKELTAKDWENKRSQVEDLKSEGLSNTEIAKRLGVSEGAIRKWLKKQKPDID